MQESEQFHEARLLADIGGTNARFALELASGAICRIQTLATLDFPRFEDAALYYLESHADLTVRHAVIAIANPVGQDAIKMTNHHWAFSVSAAKQTLGLTTLLMVNDFSALAMAVPTLKVNELRKVGGGFARKDGVIGILGAGTGLGVGALVPDQGTWKALQSEGGHVAFSPTDEREIAVLRYCWEQYQHVSTERLASGPGIALIHSALAASAGRVIDHTVTTEMIVAQGLNGDVVCLETLDCFCGMLGTFAANLAVTLFTQGGIYIGGGVVPRLGSFFARSSFRNRFEKKGRFSDFTTQIPTYVITAQQPALTGASALLAQHLQQAEKITQLGAQPNESDTKKILRQNEKLKNRDKDYAAT
jgi:glucokinase